MVQGWREKVEGYGVRVPLPNGCLELAQARTTADVSERTSARNRSRRTPTRSCEPRPAVLKT